MTRNPKILGLILAAAFALSAVAASSAMAQNAKLTSDGPVTLIGTQTPVENPTLNNRFTEFGGTTVCPNATYTGHAVGTSNFITGSPSQVTITPNYGICTALGVPMTVDMNGCDYVFDLEATTGVADQYRAKKTILCPTGQHITRTLFTTATKHAENKPFCHLTITENAAGYAGLTLTDTTNGRVDLTGTISGITMDKKSPTGSILCPEETEANASEDFDVAIDGLNELGEPTGVGLSHL